MKNSFPSAFRNMPPMAPQEDHGIVFRYDPSRNPTLDFASRTNLTQTYAGTNRTKITAANVQEVVAANTIRIDHVGTSLTPAMLMEPAAANILLEVITDWTKSALTTVTKDAVSWQGAANGAWTIVAGGADATVISTALAASSAAFTFVVAMKRKTGTGAVSMTIDNGATWTAKTLTTSFQYFNVTKTAANPQLGFKLATSGDEIIVDCLMLVPNTAIASSYFAPAAAIGEELVTNGDFSAVTATNGYTSDFSAGEDGWTIYAGGAVAGNIDGIGGEDDTLRFTIDAANSTHALRKASVFTIGNCYRVRAKVYIPSGQSNIDGVKISEQTAVITTTDSWVSVDFYANALAEHLYATAFDGASSTFQDAGGDDVFYIKDVIIDVITATGWTVSAGGWAPQATAGALTGKVQKVATAASSWIYQDIGASGANIAGRALATITHSAGTFFTTVSGVNGSSRTASGSYVDYILTAGASAITGIYGSTAAVGTVDDFSVKTHGTVRPSEANTITLTTPAAVSAALAGTGTLVVNWMPSWSKEAIASNVGIVATSNIYASLLYVLSTTGAVRTFDGTISVGSEAVYVANTWTPLAVKWPSDTDKYKVGVDVDGAGIAYGSEAAFDGAFADSGTLTLGHSLYGPMWIQWIRIYNKVLTDAQINALR